MSLLAVCALEQLHTLTVVARGLWWNEDSDVDEEDMSSDDEDIDTDEEWDRFEHGLASLQLTSLSMVYTAVPPALPDTLRRLSIKSPWMGTEGGDGRVPRDFALLGALTRLTHLKLSRTDADASGKPVDLAPLASLANLERFILKNSPRPSLVPLEGLTRLTGLSLKGMYSADGPGVDIPDGLAAMTTLKSLNLSEIVDLAGSREYFAGMGTHTVCELTKTTFM